MVTLNLWAPSHQYLMVTLVFTLVLLWPKGQCENLSFGLKYHKGGTNLTKRVQGFHFSELTKSIFSGFLQVLPGNFQDIFWISTGSSSKFPDTCYRGIVGGGGVGILGGIGIPNPHQIPTPQQPKHVQLASGWHATYWNAFLFWRWLPCSFESKSATIYGDTDTPLWTSRSKARVGRLIRTW